jgi:ATP-binding protein involved in chromosome partitioning
MPPGTGDALLTFSQEIDIDGAVIVTTPQDIAIIDVKRGIEMFKRTNVKILGIIENMTSFTSDDGVEHFIFGKDGVKNMSPNLDIELLGKIPIEIILREGADNGRPYAEFFKDTNTAKKFTLIAEKIIKKIN